MLRLPLITKRDIAPILICIGAQLACVGTSLTVDPKVALIDIYAADSFIRSFENGPAIFLQLSSAIPTVITLYLLSEKSLSTIKDHGQLLVARSYGIRPLAFHGAVSLVVCSALIHLGGFVALAALIAALHGFEFYIKFLPVLLSAQLLSFLYTSFASLVSTQFNLGDDAPLSSVIMVAIHLTCLVTIISLDPNVFKSLLVALPTFHALMASHAIDVDGFISIVGSVPFLASLAYLAVLNIVALALMLFRTNHYEII